MTTSSTHGDEKTGIYIFWRLKLDSSLSLYKTQLKMDQKLPVRHETIDGNIRELLQIHWYIGNDFLMRPQRHRQQK
jgi:hypothetical protein